MELTKEEKKYILRMQMTSILFADVMSHHYKEIQYLCETFELKNDKVIKQLPRKNKLIPPIPPSEQIFIDWAYVLFDESEHNDLILDEFLNIYKKRFPHVVKRYEKMEKKYLAKVSFTMQEIIYDFNTTEAMFLIFLLISSDIYYKEFDYAANQKDLEYIFLNVDGQAEYDLKFNTGERIVDTSQYKKYLKNRRSELAEFMSEFYSENITEKDLAKTIHNKMKSKATDKGIPTDYSVNDIIKSACRNLLFAHGGGLDWYEMLTSDYKSKVIGINLNYVPDVDYIINHYYFQLIRFRYGQIKEINKIYLIKHCKSDSPMIDLVSILFMYSVDLFSKMFMNLMEDYYKNFSWEKVVHQKLADRYESIISSLEKEMHLQKGRLENSELQIQALNEQIRKDRGEEIIPFEQSMKKLSDEIDRKDEEIESLKQQIKSMDEYVAILSGKEDTESKETVDIAMLQTKKYLFVGAVKEALPELKKTFPNSLFMETETYSLQGIQVDCVVMFIKYMSHTMFYKIKSTSALKDVPMVMCNTKNVNTIYRKMMENNVI